MDKKIAVITGGSSGIGLALARKYVLSGHIVILLARDKERLEKAKQLLSFENAEVYTYTLDVTDREMVKVIFKSILSEFGKIDVLITSAGYSLPGYIHELPSEDFVKTMDINYFGTLWAVRAVLPSMKSQGSGTILLISSGAGLLGIHGSGAYSASKFAVNGLAEALRSECAPYGIRVSVAMPPDTDTPMYRKNRNLVSWEAKTIMGSGGEFSAEYVADSIFHHVQKGTFIITTGAPLFLLKRLKSLIYPIINYVFDAMIARGRKLRNQEKDVRQPISYSQAGHKQRRYPSPDSAVH